MTGRTILVSAQWALEGKQPDGEDYRILSCSTGDLDRGRFADALSRFQVGELVDLPQVSVSYPRPGAQPGVSYVAFAIHWHATEGQCHADGVEQRDNQGRITAYTSYFCLPYRRLAKEAIGYLAMYEALNAVTLTVTDGPPIQVPIAVPMSRTPASDDLAVRVAPLLLTGRPVCVLGAEDTSMVERLEFIDTVMELLPYGFRSRMTAATWTRATNRKHGFRLFFSSAPRSDEPDWVVTWGDDPGLVPVPGEVAGDYLEWLQDYIGALARLAGLTSEMGFGPKDILKAYEAVLHIQPRLQYRPRSAARASNGRPGPPAPSPALVASDPGERVLHDCVDHVQLPNRNKLNADISVLKKLAEGGIGEDRRRRYQDVISSLGLLRPGFLLGDKSKYAEKLYDALLRLVVGKPLDYDAYCWVEKCAGIAPGAAPHQELLAAIVKTGMATPEVTAIVYWHLRGTDEKKLNRWLVSGEVTAVQLIDVLAVGWKYSQHGRILCEVTLDYLKKAPRNYQALEVRRALRQHGFLARALQALHPDNDQHQVDALRWFLKAAYPQPSATPGQDLSPASIVQILSGTGGPPPTPALLGAVLMLLRKQESWELAWNAYIRGSLTLPKLDQATLASLRDRLPYIDAAAINAPETAAAAGDGPGTTGPGHDRAGSARADALVGGIVEMDVQWALHGKSADSEDYRVLACSTGALSRANFTDAISRFRLGAVDTPPQVSVSWARLGDQPDGGYLALAIDEFAADGQRTAYDQQGNQITYTSYFCLPYRPLAERAIGYQSLYEALRDVTLPETGGPPLRVTLAAPTARTLAVDSLAMRVAALLLTGRPVCVSGAEVTSTDDRLRFIDTVMDLLPYGLRARMAATTGTRATHGDHRFRLFFSSAPRPTSPPGHVVTWGEPDRVAIPGGLPAEYIGWLENSLVPLTRLATATDEMRFSSKTGLQVLELALSSSPSRSPALTGPAASTGAAATQDPAVQDPAMHDPAMQEPSPPAPVEGDTSEEAPQDRSERMNPAHGHS